MNYFIKFQENSLITLGLMLSTKSIMDAQMETISMSPLCFGQCVCVCGVGGLVDNEICWQLLQTSTLLIGTDRDLLVCPSSALHLPCFEVIKLFSCTTQLSTNFFLLIHVKMPTIVGILTFMSGKNSIIGLSEPKNQNFLTVLYSRAFKISCSTELSMKKFYNPGRAK